MARLLWLGELLPFQVSGHPELYFPDLATGKAPCDLIYLCSFLSSLALALQLLSFDGSIGKTWHLEIEAHQIDNVAFSYIRSVAVNTLVSASFTISRFLVSHT